MDSMTFIDCSELLQDRQSIKKIMAAVMNEHTPDEWVEIGELLVQNEELERMSFEHWNTFLEEQLKIKADRESQKGRGRGKGRGGSAPTGDARADEKGAAQTATPSPERIKTVNSGM